MIDKLAIVVVTYKRQKLLKVLLESFLRLQTPPWRVVLVDNENSPETLDLVAEYEVYAEALWGPAEGDALGFDTRFAYRPQAQNLGGSGGFSAGIKAAYELGAEWFWIMDDDVAVEPEAIDRLAKWTDRFDVIQGSRLDFDGGPFYWQYQFSPQLAIYNPFATAQFDESGFKPMNTMCFEGGLISRKVVRQIGFPDYRFFIYWDDALYGYLACKAGRGAVVSDVVLRRTREVENWDIAGVRQLNSTSDTNRFYIMRNRGYMARYFQMKGDYNPYAYAAGTVLSFGKEFVRMLAVDRAHLVSGTKKLVEGWKESRAILNDPTWKPMPHPLPENGPLA
ncbi:MAG: glycosyltransferase [Coriobacteriia bacterium]|nr:glycosyltransferase [Coriobacteriia bacterium]